MGHALHYFQLYRAPRSSDFHHVTFHHRWLKQTVGTPRDDENQYVSGTQQNQYAIRTATARTESDQLSRSGQIAAVDQQLDQHGHYSLVLALAIKSPR